MEDAFRIVGQETCNLVQLEKCLTRERWDGVKTGYRRTCRDNGLVKAARTNATKCVLLKFCKHCIL